MTRGIIVTTGLIALLLAGFAIWRFVGDEDAQLEDGGRRGGAEVANREAPELRPRRESGEATAAAVAPAGVPEGAAFLRGRVVLGEDGPPAPGARVLLRLLGGEPLAEAGADANGVFALAAPAGEADLVLRAEHENLVSREMVDLELSPGEERDLGAIVILPALEIRGRVRDGHGNPVAGARLRLVPNLPITGFSIATVKQMLEALETDDEALAERTSDEAGAYVFEAVAAGCYAVIAEAEGFALAFSRRLSLRPGQAREEVDFALVPGCTLRGRVTGAEGRGVAGALVSVLPTGNDFPGLFRTVKVATDANGDYEIASLPPGRLMLTCRKEGYAPFGDDPRLEQDRSLDIALTPGWRLTGVVLELATDRPIPEVEIGVISDDSLAILRALTDAEGKFEFPHVPDAKLEAIVVHKEGLQVVAGDRMRVMNGPFSVIDPEKDENGRNPEHLEIRMTGGGRIEGRVIDADSGAGIAGARVYSLGSGDTELAMFSAGNGVISDAEGRFVLAGVAAGPYVLGATARGYYPVDVVTRDRLRGRDGSLELIAPGQTVTDAAVKLRRGLAHRGRVLTPEGEALPGALISFIQPSERMGNFELMLTGLFTPEPTISDETGRFVLEGLRPGAELRIEAEHPDHKGGALAEVPGDRLGAEETTIRLAAGGRIAGQMQIEGGGSPEGLVVTLQRQVRIRSPFEAREVTRLETTSDAAGRFTFENLAAGDYGYSVHGNDELRAPRANQRVTVTGGATTRLVIDLFRNWKIEGRVVDESGGPWSGCQVRAEAIDPEGLVAAERKEEGRPDRGRSRAWARTDGDGRFVLSELDGRFDYDIRVQGPQDRSSPTSRPEAAAEGVKVGTGGLVMTMRRP